MGWTFTNQTKAALVAELLQDWESVIDDSDFSRRYYPNIPAGTRITSKAIRHRLVGNELWYVRETVRTFPDGRQESERWIGVDLLESNGRGWGYKSMSEDMGPYYYGCPVEYLELAPQPESEYAGKWREAIRARNAPQLVTA